MKKVLAAMSGGVDSSVMAVLLKDAGYEVVAMTMRLGVHDTVEMDSDKPSCCSLEGVEDARRVAAQLDIPFYAVNYEDAFAETIVDYFVKEYSAGRTPNPCILCNQDLKFGKLMHLADELGLEYVATGHYARIERDQETGHFLLKKAVDATKDQSYVLFSLTQEQLSRALMPLGNYTKVEVREIARERGLKTHAKPESQELCFIGDDDYKRFLRERIPDQIRPGPIMNQNNEVIGEHAGTPFYTIGQRKGLNLALGKPMYVTRIDAQTNTLMIGESADLLRKECFIEKVNWIIPRSGESPVRATVKIRYKDRGVPATIYLLSGDRAHVCFDEPRRAITPGQAAVFYDGDTVLGGGWIDERKIH